MLKDMLRQQQARRQQTSELAAVGGRMDISGCSSSQPVTDQATGGTEPWYDDDHHHH